MKRIKLDLLDKNIEQLVENGKLSVCLKNGQVIDMTLSMGEYSE